MSWGGSFGGGTLDSHEIKFLQTKKSGLNKERWSHEAGITTQCHLAVRTTLKFESLNGLFCLLNISNPKSLKNLGIGKVRDDEFNLHVFISNRMIINSLPWEPKTLPF